MGKLVIFSALSGSGKSTIVKHLLQQNLNLQFSISATSRLPRGVEQDGVDYYFLSPEQFKEKIANGEFVEYEEVYPGRFYGTLKSEIQRISAAGNNIIFDVDVVGGSDLKQIFGEAALSVFIQPPSIEELHHRLVTRNTDAPEVIETRVKKAEQELTYASKFDVAIVNDDLEKAKRETIEVISKFLKK